MGLVKTVILKSNMSCNLRCKYCYEFNRNGHCYDASEIKASQLAGLIERFARLFPGSRILWMLHGGEPLINGIEYFRSFVSCIRHMNTAYDVEYSIALQTNATLLTDEWIEALEESVELLSERVVSVSIDGPESINDEVRVTRSGKPSSRMILDAIARLRRSKLTFSTISVVGSHNVNRPDETYRFIREVGPALCKFIPCYNFGNGGETELYGITPVQYARFMCRVFDLWVHDLVNEAAGRWFVIDPIATIISKLSGTFVTWCEYRGAKCDNFLCLYPDGELWLCDTFNHDAMRDHAYLGNVFSMDDEELARAVCFPCDVCAFDKFYKQMVAECLSCNIYRYCKGGCLPYRHDMRVRGGTLFKEYCDGKRLLISHIKRVFDSALSQSEDNIQLHKQL